jgi:hypothetical protein
MEVRSLAGKKGRVTDDTLPELTQINLWFLALTL